MILDGAAAGLRLLPAEAAHRATIALTRLASPFLARDAADDSRLAVEALGLRFPSPVGLAAGFDKNAEVPDAMLRLGFGFVECGTVTPRPQAGNPKPRLFRLREDGAVINRMGFNNQGVARVAGRLSRRKAGGILGLNIGANRDSADRIADYRQAFAALAPFADYVAVNVSSPNTPGLRGLQNREELARLLSELNDERARAKRAKPLLVKIAPDLDGHALDDIAHFALAARADGSIATNPTVARPASLKSPNAHEGGGLSGKPLFDPSTLILREMRRRLGPSLVLVGVGGISSGADAYAKIRAGASLVQLYTALAFSGPGLVRRLEHELLDCLRRDGYSRLSDAVGADVPATHG